MQCKNCFFTDKFPGIEIKKNGMCNYCNNAIHGTIKINHDSLLGIDRLQDVARELKAKKMQYDCLLPVSGGLDSSYTIYVAVKILGLNPLAISYDSGFSTDIARKNVETICRNLKVKLVIVKSKKGYDKKYVKFITYALKDINLYWGVCVSCIYMICAIIAQYGPRGRNIPTFFMTSNLYEEEIFLKKTFKVKTMIKRFFKISPAQIARMIVYMIVAQYYLLRLKMEFYVPPMSNLFRNRPKNPAGIRWINIEKYIKWDIDAMITELEKIGWERPAAPQLPLRFDCKIEKSLINHTFKEVADITAHGIICNNFIYDAMRKKYELKKSVEWYENILPFAMDEIMHDLNKRD